MRRPARALALAAAALLPRRSGGDEPWGAPQGLGWQQAGATPPWQPHTGSLAVPLADGSVVLLAGQAGRHGGATFDCFNCTNEVWRFRPEGAEWQSLSTDVPWDPRWGHSALATADDTVWMMFGCCKRGRPTVMLRDIWTFNPTLGRPWARVSAEPPFEGIQAASIALRGTEIWVVGGWSQHRATLSIVCMLDTVHLKWTTKSKNGDPAWRTRADHATAISPDGRWLIMFGGQHTPDGGRHWYRLTDTWKVPLPSGLTSEWEQLGDLASARSSPSLLVLHTGWVVTVGGHWTPDMELLTASQENESGMKAHHEATEFRVYNDVLALDLAGGAKEWRVVESEAPWPARDDAAACVSSGGDALLFGGGTLYGGGGYLQDVWRLPDVALKYALMRHAGDEL